MFGLGYKPQIFLCNQESLRLGESISECEVKVGTLSQFLEADILRALKAKLSHLHWNDYKAEETQRNVRVASEKLEGELPNVEFANKNLRGRLLLEFGKSGSSMMPRVLT